MGIPPYFDPEGEYEPSTTIYTLAAYCPERPPTGLKKLFADKRKNCSHRADMPLHNHNPDLDNFTEKDLARMQIKDIKIKTVQFPVSMRCEHLPNDTNTCREGCYVLEKKGGPSRYRCARNDCQGHVYSGAVKREKDNVECFGNKGERLVLLDRQMKP